MHVAFLKKLFLKIHTVEPQTLSSSQLQEMGGRGMENKAADSGSGISDVGFSHITDIMPFLMEADAKVSLLNLGAENHIFRRRKIHRSHAKAMEISPEPDV